MQISANKHAHHAPSLAIKLREFYKRPDTYLGAGFILAFLICYGFTALLIINLYSQQTEITLQEYGNTTARQLALSTEDAVARGDLISLHAQLEDLTEIPTLPEAAVYDMENKVLAQSLRASLSSDAEKDIHHFSAIITFQDTIAGKVIVGLNASELKKNDHWLYGYLFCGFLLSIFLSALVSRHFVSKASNLYRELLKKIYSLQPNVTEEFSFAEDGSLPTLKHTFQQLLNLQEYIAQLEQGAPVVRFSQTGKITPHIPLGSYAELLLHCENFEALQQSIHHRELNRLLINFQQQVAQVSDLYSAQNIQSPGNHILLRFYHDDITDAGLQAVCSAVILRNLIKAAQDSAIALQFQFVIHWHQHDERTLSDMLRNHLLLQECKDLESMCSHAKSGDIIVSKGIKCSSGVAEQVKLELISGDTEAEFYRVQNLSDNYKKLLEQQIQNLLNSETGSQQQ